MRRMMVGAVGLAVLAGCGSGEIGPASTTSAYEGPAVHVRQCASGSAGDPVDLTSAAEAVSQRLVTLGLEGTVEVIDERCIEVVIHYPTRAEADVAAAQMEQEATSNKVHVRPVVGACQVVDAAATSSSGDLGLDPPDPSSTQYLRMLGDPVQVCMVGPALASGDIFTAASAQEINGGWGVTVDFRPGGLEQWNAAAAECFDRTAVCPTGQLAIELDGVIQTAPTVNAREFESSVQIAGSFTESDAKLLARVINAGSLPVQLVVESVTASG